MKQIRIISGVAEELGETALMGLGDLSITQKCKRFTVPVVAYNVWSSLTYLVTIAQHYISSQDEDQISTMSRQVDGGALEQMLVQCKTTPMSCIESFKNEIRKINAGVQT